MQSLKNLLVVLILVILNSCALWKSKEEDRRIIDTSDPLKAFKSSLTDICLSGAGKGKLNFFEERHSFAFESFLEKDEAKWTMAFQIPFQDDELIRIHFGDVLERSGDIKVDGSFYQKLTKSNSKTESGRQALRLLDRSLAKLGIFLKYYSLGDQVAKCFFEPLMKAGQKVYGTCRAAINTLGTGRGPKNLFKWKIIEDKFIITSAISRRYRFNLAFHAKDDQLTKFKQMELYLTDNQQSLSKGSKKSTNPLVMKFFLEECF